MAALRSFLLSQIGYKRLTDSYHPDEFRLALYQNELQVEATSKNNAGTFDITFFCKPQRYLLSGETVQTFTAN
jgi:phage-related protein